MPASPELMNKIKALYPWMTEGLLNTYSQSWTQYESGDVALAEVRQTEEYQTIFKGNYDAETGGVRMSESDYFASKAEFDANLIGIGINPDLFEDEWEAALEGEVSPREMNSRIEAAYERIIDSAPAIRDYYAQNFGIEMTDAAIVASVLKPSLGEQVLNKQISMAEIGGEAALRGYEIASGMAESLFRAGLGRDEAAGLFGAASNQLPILDVLAKRHQDPDDDFDLQEFVTAGIYDDPQQRRRMRRLIAQEGSMFGSREGGAERSRTTGAMTGLTAQ